jgi:hypothetical protein
MEETQDFKRILPKSLQVSIILPIFAPSKDKDMEEKRYPTVEEESFGGKVSEPIAAPVPDIVSSGGFVTDDEWVSDYSEADDVDLDRMPPMGPFTDEEAIARIEEAMRDLKDPSKWITSEQMWENLYKKYPWLR